MTDEVLVETADSVMTITLNRPDQRNAMTLTAATVVGDALTELDARDDLKVAILCGSGTTFCAGMDLKRFALGERPHIPGQGFGGLTERVLDKPLIAAVEGAALGGGFEMVLACDLVTAGRSARFGLPEVKRGLVARGGGMFRLPTRLPRAIALEVLLTGDPVSAEQAAAYGLVNRVVEDGGALPEARRLAAAIAANAPLAVQASKAVALRSRDWSDADGFQCQRWLSDKVFASRDAAEGAASFLEKRPAVWQGL